MLFPSECSLYPDIFQSNTYISGKTRMFSYIKMRKCHYPHISFGDEDKQNNFGFHITIQYKKHVFFKYIKSYPYCKAVKYDDATDVKNIIRYAYKFASELHNLRF